MDNYNFSVIIPTKNTIKLLQDCLDSIPLRNDLEVIIVDDNSNPQLVDFEHYPGKDRPNTQVIFTKDDKGAGFARNVGVLNAKGKWIIFSDSDDTFETDSINKMLNTYRDFSADIIFFNANRVDELTGEVLSQHLSKNKYEKDKKHYEDFLRYRSNVPWAKMIKRELIEKNSIRFSEVPAANDLFFSAVSGYYAKGVIIDFTVIYNWKVRKSGSITSTVTRKSLFSKLCEASKKNEFLWEKGKKTWCTNLYTAFYWRLRGVGLNHKEAIRGIDKYVNVGPMVQWKIEFWLSWPFDVIRKKTH